MKCWTIFRNPVLLPGQDKGQLHSLLPADVISALFIWWVRFSNCDIDVQVNYTSIAQYWEKATLQNLLKGIQRRNNWSSTGAGPGLLGAVVAVMDVGVRHQIHRGLGVLVHQPRPGPPPAHAATADHQMWGWLILFPNWTYSLQLYHCLVQTRNCCTRKCGKGFTVCAPCNMLSPDGGGCRLRVDEHPVREGHPRVPGDQRRRGLHLQEHYSYFTPVSNARLCAVSGFYSIWEFKWWMQLSTETNIERK